MSQFGLPTTKFHIICKANDQEKGKTSTNPGPNMCTPLVFNTATGAGDFEHWLLVQPDPSVDEWGFQNVASKNWAFARIDLGRVVGCFEYNRETCIWLPIRLEDGTYISHTRSNSVPTRIGFWVVNDQHLLALTHIENGPLTESSMFIFPPDGAPPAQM